MHPFKTIYGMIINESRNQKLSPRIGQFIQQFSTYIFSIKDLLNK